MRSPTDLPGSSDGLQLYRSCSRSVRGATSTQQTQLTTESLSGGAVQEEVDGMVGVHQQLGGCQRQADATRRDRSGVVPFRAGRPDKMMDKRMGHSGSSVKRSRGSKMLDKRCDDQDGTARQGGDEKGKGDGQKGDDQARVRGTRWTLGVPQGTLGIPEGSGCSRGTLLSPGTLGVSGGPSVSPAATRLDPPVLPDSWSRRRREVIRSRMMSEFRMRMRKNGMNA